MIRRPLAAALLATGITVAAPVTAWACQPTPTPTVPNPHPTQTVPNPTGTTPHPTSTVPNPRPTPTVPNPTTTTTSNPRVTVTWTGSNRTSPAAYRTPKGGVQAGDGSTASTGSDMPLLGGAAAVAGLGVVLAGYATRRKGTH